MVTRCVRCGQLIDPGQGRWFAGPPIPSGVQKCQRCGPFSGPERAFFIDKMRQGAKYPSAAPCACKGLRR